MKLITQTLAEINAGKFVEEASEAMQRIVGACSQIGKPGELTIKLKFKPGKGGQMMQVEHELIEKEPQHDRPVDYMFVTKDRDLVRQNPNQGELPLVSIVREETGEIQQVPRDQADTLIASGAAKAA